MSTTAARQVGAAAAAPADVPAPSREDRPVAGPAAWLGVALATLLAWAVLTWPLALHLDHFWTMEGNAASSAEPNFVARPGAVMSGDFMQTVFIQSVVVDNVRHLRNPFVDLREGAAGLTDLHTTSLDVPWSPAFALLWPLLGMVPAYNVTLLLATLATGLAAFGWLRRHVRWPLLAAAGALAYTFAPNRMFQLTSHFNAMLWWAFPAALWAFEAALERHGEGRRWRAPAAGLAAVVLTVALSGEYHLTLYMTGLLAFTAVWALAAARLGRRPVPLGPALVTVASLAVGAAYVVLVFRYAFKGTVSGENGSFQQVELYAPDTLLALVTKTFGTQGEGMIYVGLPLVLLAVAGFVLAVTGRRRGALPYAVLAVPLLFLTHGPAADVGPLRPYRLLFDHLPFLSLQRVPERLMAVTALMLAFLAVSALDQLSLSWPGRPPAAAGTGAGAGGAEEPAAAGAAVASAAEAEKPDWIEAAQAAAAAVPERAPSGAVRDRVPERLRPWLEPGRAEARRLAAGALLLATVLLLADYRVSENRLQPDLAHNKVVAAMRSAGDAAGPVLGLPALKPQVTWNSASTYLAAQSRRRVLNAYNQTPARWLDDRMQRLEPLNRGVADVGALEVLRTSGTRYVLVVDEPRVFARGEWRQTVAALVASGRFKLLVADGPLALLELVGGQSPSSGGEQPGAGSDPAREL